MTAPAVSVVIPFYNAGGQLERAVRSVFGQSFADWELILVDDGSTDGSRALAAQLIAGEARAKLILQDNRGVSAARNRGTTEASATLVAFLDADDEFMPDFLKICLELTRRQPDAVLWGTRFYLEKAGKRTEPDSCGLPENDDSLIADYFLTAGGFPPVRAGSAIMLKEALLAAGGFPEGVRWGEDLDTWLRLGLNGRFAICRSFGHIFHTGHGGRASWNSDKREYPTLSRQTELEYCSKLRDNLREPYLREYFNWFRLVAAADCLRLGQRDTAKEMLALASGTQKYTLKLRNLRIKSMAPAPLMKAAARLRALF